ncbi:hypothetical protein JOQ06_001648, partial [Pogonophryne albipinna]
TICHSMATPPTQSSQPMGKQRAPHTHRPLTPNQLGRLSWACSACTTYSLPKSHSFLFPPTRDHCNPSLDSSSSSSRHILAACGPPHLPSVLTAPSFAFLSLTTEQQQSTLEILRIPGNPPSPTVYQGQLAD